MCAQRYLLAWSTQICVWSMLCVGCQVWLVFVLRSKACRVGFLCLLLAFWRDAVVLGVVPRLGPSLVAHCMLCFSWACGVLSDALHPLAPGFVRCFLLLLAGLSLACVLPFCVVGLCWCLPLWGVLLPLANALAEPRRFRPLSPFVVELP